jgi:hypothetical protein
MQVPAPPFSTSQNAPVKDMVIEKVERINAALNQKD